MGLYWIRPATTHDAESIARVNQEAFGQNLEAQLVETLERDGLVLISLVAQLNAGAVAGHILFSRVHLNTGAPAASLAPVAVVPSEQGKGIGSALIGAGLDACRELGIAVVVVLGHPEYYPRFGFSSEAGRLLASPYAGHGDAWMALELIPGAIPASGAAIEYPPAWSAFS